MNVNFNRVEGVITITQERYLTNRIEEREHNFWWIPFNFVTESEKYNKTIKETLTPDGWLNDKTVAIKHSDIRPLKNEKWIIFNKKQTGMYRVNYNNETWYAIIRELKYDYDIMTDVIEARYAIDHQQRSQLIDDSFDLARSGRLSYDVPLSLLEYFKTADYESNRYSYESADRALTLLNTALFGSEFYGRFLKYIKTIFRDKFEKLGVEESEYEEQNIIRKYAIKWTCKAQLKSCLDKTHSAFVSHITYEKTIPLNMRDVILENGMQTANEDEFWGFWSLIPGSSDVVQDEIIAILTMIQNSTIRDEFLRTVIIDNYQTIKGTKLKYTEKHRIDIILGVMKNSPDGFRAVQDFLLDYTEKIPKM